MGFENNFFNNRGEEKSGVALEQEFFGGIDQGLYKKLAIEALAGERLKEKGMRLAIKDIKSRNMEMYNGLIEEARLEYLRNIRNPILTKEGMFEIVKRSQSGRPSTPFISDMKKSLAARLKLEPKAVNFYSALGTNADYCGVDGIFSINLQGYNFDIAVDITKESTETKMANAQEKMARGGKYFGDVVFSLSNHEDDYNPERDAELIPKFTKDLVENLKEQVNEFNNRIETKK